MSKDPQRANNADSRERILDELLVIRVQEGSRTAMEQLVERWQRRLFSYARRLTGSEDAAWDVLQETWLAVANGISSLRDPAALPRWLYTILNRAATNRFRNKTPETSVPADTLEQAPKDRRERGEREAAVHSLRSALDALPPHQQALLHMHYLEGFQLWELAETLRVPEGTVKSRLFHARQRVKQILTRMES